MRLLPVTNAPSFREALAWARAPAGAPPRVWPPRGLHRLDDSWLAASPTHGPRRPSKAAFLGLPETLAKRAWAACGLASAAAPPQPPTETEQIPPRLALCCARFCWADLVDMEPAASAELELLRPLGNDASSSPQALLNAMVQLRPATLLRGVSLAGLADLGGLLARAPDRTAAAICARLPPGWEKRAWEARSESTAPKRAALLQLKTVLTTGDPTEALFTLGASSFAALLSLSHLRRQQTAQLLPVPAAHHLLTAPPHRDEPRPSKLASALAEAAQDTAQESTQQAPS